jgi:hypothetical protein
MDAIGWAVLCGMLGVMVTVFWREHAEEERSGRKYLAERIRALENYVAKQEHDAQAKPASA